MEKKANIEKSVKKEYADPEQRFLSNEVRSNGVDVSTCQTRVISCLGGDESESSIKSVQQMKAYVRALKEHKKKMSAMIENVMKIEKLSKTKNLENVRVWEKTSGKPSKIECGIPLIMKIPILHDASHVINDVFGNYICRDLPGNKRKLFDKEELKEHLSLMEDIRCAEKDVMEVQERLLKAGIKENHQIKLNLWNVENYSLFQCPQKIDDDDDVTETKSKGAAKDNGDKKVVYGIHSELRRLRLRLNKERPKLNIKYCVTQTPPQERPMVVKKPDKMCFAVNTEIVYFNNFAPGGIYKKTVTITNVGKNTASFILFEYINERNKDFEYNYSPKCPIAPGMKTKLTVTFKCTSTYDTFDLIAIMTKDHVRDIPIIAENSAPLLRYIVEGYDLEMETSNKESTSEYMEEYMAVFECNACLVGATKTVKVTVENLGRTAKFFCVTEDDWYLKKAEDIKWNKTMELGAFQIIPSVFEIHQGQSIPIFVKFKPTSPSFYCSRFIIMSDNSLARDVNVFGDGLMFDDESVWIEERDSLQSSEAGRRRYVLDMGKIGQVIRYVYAKNASRIEYPYRWIINHEIVRPACSENAKVNFNIHPSMGWLDKVSETVFRVECAVTNEIVDQQLTGEYRVTATLLIDDIPKESINNPSIFYEKQEDSPESVSVKIAEIEVISEYKSKERVSLTVDPMVVDLSWYRLETISCVKETVTFVNDGLLHARVSWIPNDDERTAAVRVRPENFAVFARTKIDLLIEPRRPGPLRETLEFRAENDDGHATRLLVYVRGVVHHRTPPEEVRVSGGQALVSPSHATVCAGTPASHAVRLRVEPGDKGDRFSIQRRTYVFDVSDDKATGVLTERGAVKSFGPYAATAAASTLDFEAPLQTEATGISCQLAEWSLAGSKTVCYTQAVTYAQLPNVRLNVNAITVTEALYTGISHTHRGIRLLNNTHCDFVYSWGNPIGPHANNIDCVFKPTNGTVGGSSVVEFELIITPKMSGHVSKCYAPFFIQCDFLTPQRISIECWVKEFSATVEYVDMFESNYSITWQNSHNQWVVNDSFNEMEVISEDFNFEDGQISKTISSDTFGVENSQEYEIEPEDQEPAKWRFGEWPRRDTLLWSPAAEQFGRVSDHYNYPVMAFRDIECNTAVMQRIIVRNTTKIPCRVKTTVDYYEYSKPNKVQDKCTEDVSKKHCLIWIEKDNHVLSDLNEQFAVSIWVLVTTWGWYKDTVILEFHVGTKTLPTIRIPLIIQAVTFPLEFPLACAEGQEPTIKFSLFSMDSETRLQILNNSEIPLQISWRTYNKSGRNNPFGLVFDTLTPDIPNLWSFRIDRYYGNELPRYFKIRPIILKLEPKELGFVTFFLDRTKEIMVPHDENNMVLGQAIGTVTALELTGKHCIRDDGFKLNPTVVKLFSETRHSIQPNLVLRELDNIFQVSATQVYDFSPPYHTVTRSFTMLNLLRYPATVLFKIDNPFVIKKLRTLRCGSLPGDRGIKVYCEDLIEIELDAKVDMTQITTPKMPMGISSRKNIQTGFLYAVCENSYFKPKMVAPFELHVYFPILKLSTRNINFGQVVVRETKSADVMLSSYPGSERFAVRSKNKVFTISPTEGVVSHKPTPLTVTFKPRADVWYSNKIEILTTIPKDVIFLEVSGFGIK